jgi:hypothetical protein
MLFLIIKTLGNQHQSINNWFPNGTYLLKRVNYRNYSRSKSHFVANALAAEATIFLQT